MDKGKKLSLTNACRNGIYRIVGFQAQDVADRRLVDLGFVDGTEIEVLGKAVFKTTLAVKIRNSTICIRRAQADRIFVEKVKNL